MIPRIVNGIPTDVDVRALMDAFGVPEIGAVIQYGQVSDVIHVAKASNRWRTVTSQWRKKMIREHRVFLLCRDGAFVSASEVQKSEYSGDKQRRGIRFIKVSSVIDRDYIDTARLPDDERKAHEHRSMVNATLMQSARQMAKRRAPELPTGVKEGA